MIYLVYSIDGCIKVSQPCSKSYTFGFPISVTPQDTFIVGDTIWWEMDIPNQLFDTTSGEYIDLTDFDLFFRMSIGKLEHNGPNVGYTPAFKFTAEIGSIVEQINSFNSIHILTQSVQDKRFKIGCTSAPLAYELAELGSYRSGNL